MQTLSKSVTVKMALFFMILVTMLFLTPSVRADGDYTIELEGYRWLRSQIPIEIDTTNQTLYNSAIDAVGIWNKAMNWMRDAYDPQGSLYQFTITPSGLVTIHFGIPYQYQQTSYSKVSFPCYQCTGITYYYNNGYEMTHVDITINDSSYLANSAFGVRVTILQALNHELGHALGLGHTALTQDLMNQYFDIGKATGVTVYPTTLDLYGIQVLADGVVKDSVTLPSNIPYQVFPMKRQVSVKVPAGVSVKIDGNSYSSGALQLTVGQHTIESPAIVQIDEGTRLRFVSWRESGTTMSQQPAMTLQVLDNISLDGVYATQYRLAIADFTGNVVNEWWYDSGATAGFVPPTTTKDTIAMEGLLGLIGGRWRLQGWLDNGNAIPPNSQIIMNEPHIIRPNYAADYTIPIALLLLIAALVTMAVLVTRRPVRHQAKKRAQVRDSLFCINCGVELPPKSEFCNQCGSAQS
jgi:hypothetical protein